MTRPLEEWLTQPGGIADRLLGMRRRADLTGAQLAAEHGWTPSKVSKIENGKQTPTVADIHAWTQSCHAADEADDLVAELADIQTQHRSWRRRMRQGQAAVQAEYNELIRRASVVRDFTMTFVPGLLQTSQYAHVALHQAVKLHGASGAEVGEAVAVRMQRQQYLYDPGKRFEFLLAEPVLRWLFCPPEVMRGQLDRLVTVVGLPNVRFGVLPLGVPLSLAPQNSFTLVDDVVLVEGFAGESSPSELLDLHARALDRLWVDAAEGDSARELIVRAADLLPT